ncbi:MAG: biotin synthase BioB [Phycisphaerae bacterium]|nr:biotin synthase BioB [Phycisphaerae bacterium]
MDPVISQLAGLVLAGEAIDREGAMQLADVTGERLYDLFYWANRVRMARFGLSVTFCSIAAGRVGGCSEDCKFCAQSARHQTHIQAGPAATDAQLVAAAREAVRAGAGSFGIVNPGRSPSAKELAGLADSYRELAAVGSLRLCASLGCLTLDQARRLCAMGVRRYNHNLETSRRFYPSIVSTHAFDDRVNTLRNVKAAGMDICSGGIFNLGETWADRVDMAITLRELGAVMVPLNFLHPIPGTPLADRPAMPAMDVLKVVAIYRLLLPGAEIKLAGGRELNLRDLQSWMFYCGATSAMVGNYLTTCGRPTEQDQAMVRDLGLTLRNEHQP